MRSQGGTTEIWVLETFCQTKRHYMHSKTNQTNHKIIKSIAESPSSIPVSFFTENRNLNKSKIKSKITTFILSRDLSNKLLLLSALVQLLILGFIALKFAKWHLYFITTKSKETENFLLFLIYNLPGLTMISITTGFMVWPGYILVNSFRSHRSQDLDTIQPSLELIRRTQARLYSNYVEREFQNEAVAFCESVGDRLPEEIKAMILERVRDSCVRERKRMVAPLLWRSKLRYQNEPSWDQTTELWSSMMGVRTMTRNYWPVRVRGLWVGVFTRDVAAIIFGVGFRYSILVWITR